jgi:hypothetical protein
MTIAGIVLVASSSSAVLLACVALFDALRSSGPRRLAVVLLAPLALFAVMHLTQAGLYCASLLTTIPPSVFHSFAIYFGPELLAENLAGLVTGSGAWPIVFYMEAAKWCLVLASAVWLTIAQLVARRQ